MDCNLKINILRNMCKSNVMKKVKKNTKKILTFD